MANSSTKSSRTEHQNLNGIAARSLPTRIGRVSFTFRPTLYLQRVGQTRQAQLMQTFQQYFVHLSITVD
jgi:hypothetical protein